MMPEIISLSLLHSPRSRVWLLITHLPQNGELHTQLSTVCKQENLHVQIFLVCRTQNLHYHSSSPPCYLANSISTLVSRANFFHIAFPYSVLSFLPNILAVSWIDFYNFSCQSARGIAPPSHFARFLKTNVDYKTLF